jgi:[ribosomal protein S18]-alanine N-acetyltransferase
MTDSSPPPEVPAARLVRAGDGRALAELFAAIQDERFHPHALTREEADRLAAYRGRDVYAVLEAGDGRFVAYGLLRGWDEGYAVPSLGIAVRAGERGRGHGRRMMHWLATEARRRGADRIRLRVDPGNTPARRLYEQLGYEPIGEERGEIVMVLELSDGARPDHGPEDQ